MKVICPLGLDVQKFHECPNDYIIYRKEHAYLHSYPVCKTFRYKRVTNQDDCDEDEHEVKGPPAKVCWYLLVLSHLKHLFANKKEAKLMH